jgi:hypothetical protein
MALPSSGAISLNEIHIEAGGTTGTLCSINDADIRALISKGSEVQMAFNEWYGASSSLYSADMHSEASSYRGVQLTTKPNGSWTSQNYGNSGTLSDDTFDPIASQGIASSSTQSTPAIIRDMFTNNALTQTYFRIWAVTEPSDSGWTTLRCQGTGGDTTDNSLDRVDGNAFYNSSQGYRQYRWGTTGDPQVLIPAYDTDYTITAT